MEVNDSVIISTVDETGQICSKENGGRSSRQSVCRTVLLKDDVVMQTEEEPIYSEEILNSDCENSFKSKVSEKKRKSKEGSRDDLNSNKKTGIASSNENVESSTKEAAHPFNARQKRSNQFEFRKSGSNDLLLGFNEKGEGVYVKDEDGTLLKSTIGVGDQNEEEEEDRSPASKKLKQSPSHTLSTKVTPEAQSPASSPKRNLSRKTPTPLVRKTSIISLLSQKSPAASPVPTKSPSLSPATGRNSIVSPGSALSKQSGTIASPNAHIVGDNTVVPDSEVKSDQQQNLPNSLTNKKPPSAQDEFYKLPFKHGWKRELVWRANMETSKDKADVYFISPTGKKLRTRNDILQYLDGELTIDHFSFAREPLGAGPEFETVRSAKAGSRFSLAASAAAVTPPTPMGKRVSKPKAPKGASPPPQGWTPTRALKVNNAALISRSSTPAASRSGTSSGTAKNSKVKKATPTADVTSVRSKVPTAATHEPCTMQCLRASGQIPQLQCVKCLCLYHHECVGLNRNNSDYRVTSDAKISDSKKRDYICEACKPTSGTLVTKTSVRPTVTLMNPGIAAVRPLASNKAVASVKSAVSTQVASNVRSTVAVHSKKSRPLPQSITVIKGKKYITLSRPLHVPNVTTKDIENDLKHLNDTLQNRKKPITTTALEDAPKPQPTGYTDTQKKFCYNFFSNIACAYDVLTSIFKYLKIHERSRAASVCKLWNLAAKDTSLWQTVRMKNSKVCNWQGFANALRRGETKHLDLRKMLITGSRSDEMWQDFCNHIGVAASLEVIDLCRCSARVIESLCKSNRNLRILNALAIAGDKVHLESLELLQNLEELRLRPCEPGSIESTLEPLQNLHNMKHLSLTGIRGLGKKNIGLLGDLKGLRSMELGECGDFDSTFAEAVLPKLSNLQRLRLENGQEVNCCTLEILEAVARLDQLNQLELVNFDIKQGFDSKLQQCTNIRKLLIIPTYLSQSATTNSIMLNAALQVADTMQVLTWGVTVELLRVTALYVGDCDEPKKKVAKNFNECIPVLKPVPGAPPQDPSDTDDDPDVLIKILSLHEVETILNNNMPDTKLSIVKMPYHATSKQQLVE